MGQDKDYWSTLEQFYTPFYSNMMQSISWYNEISTFLWKYETTGQDWQGLL
jgi:hypothetical protein